MRVRVKLFAGLNRYLQGQTAGSPLEIEVPEGATLETLVRQLGLPPEEVRVIFVNGRAQPLTFGLHEQDEIGIFPPIGGG